jgi:hypothetical protein
MLTGMSLIYQVILRILGKYILYNFHGGTSSNSINILNGTPIGTIYAPNSGVVKEPNGDIEGQVISNTYIHKGGEVHYQIFGTTLNCGTPVVSCDCESSNLIQNSEFESNTNNWTVSTGQFTISSGGPSGNYAILNNGNTSDDNAIYQDVQVSNGGTYSFSAITARHSGTNSYMKLMFYNGNSLISETAPAYSAQEFPNFNTISFSGTLPSGTTKVRIYGFAKSTALKVDKVIFKQCYAPIIMSQGTTVQPTCSLNNGSIVVNTTGGTGNFQYRINGGTYQSSNSFGNLSAGTYSIDVKDLGSTCTKNLSVTLTCVNNCTNTITDPEPSVAEVNPGQLFNLTVNSNAASNIYIEWVRSSQNVTSLDQLTDKTVVGGGYVTNGGVTIQVTAPSTVGTYYYYACFKPLDACATFVKHKITVKTIGTNDPVCLSGARVLSDNLLQGACNSSASIYYSVWLNMNSSSGKPNYQHFKSIDLKFEEYCDGTAKLYGKACAVGGGTNDCIDVVYTLSGRTQTTPQYSPKANSCTTYGNDLYYYTNATGTIKGNSSGIYSGMEINISDTYNNTMPSFQLGTGANVNTNNYGASGWYGLSFVSGGTNGWSAKTSHGDFNFNVGNLIPFELEATASAPSVCLDGSVTLNAQFKGEVPTICGLSYSWKAPDGSTVSTSQSYSISNIQINQQGVYTVTATFTSGGKTCSTTATVNIVVDSNCEGTPVCLPDCTPTTFAQWNLNACNTGTGGNWYGEFTAQTSNAGCSKIEATTVYRVNPDVNKHSCAVGPDGSDAMCVDGVSSSSTPGQGNSKAVRFSTTITPGSGKTYNLSELTFKYKRSGYQCSTGGSQSLVLYVYKNGVKVYDKVITGLTTSWKTETVAFNGGVDFVSDAASTYDFEIVGFNPTGGCTVWEIDDVKLT